MQKLSANAPEATGIANPQLANELHLHSDKCIECKLCRKECNFLQKYGTPKQIADTYAAASAENQLMPFECSLCGLCATVCPTGINPASMFLEMRKEYAENGLNDFSGHSAILAYERKGASKRYSYYGLPVGCDTVMFPGCTLPGTRPGKVQALFTHLQKKHSDPRHGA